MSNKADQPVAATAASDGMKSAGAAQLAAVTKSMVAEASPLKRLPLAKQAAELIKQLTGDGQGDGLTLPPPVKGDDPHVASMGLSPESARLARADHIVAGQTNPADKARTRGFYDFMFGIQSRASEYNDKLRVSYEQGLERGKKKRELYAGKPWYEIEKKCDGGAWAWRIYREGYYVKGGEAKSEKQADSDIDFHKIELMEKRGDFEAKQQPSVDDELSDDPNSPNYRYRDTGYIAGSRRQTLEAYERILQLAASTASAAGADT